MYVIFCFVLPCYAVVTHIKGSICDAQIGVLEDTRNRTFHGILRVQSCFRGYKARCFVKETRKGIFTLQSCNISLPRLRINFVYSMLSC